MNLAYFDFKEAEPGRPPSSPCLNRRLLASSFHINRDSVSGGTCESRMRANDTETAQIVRDESQENEK